MKNLLSATALLALTVACAPERREFQITEQPTSERPAPRLGASSAERFGFQAAGGMGETAAKPFDYVLPPGWTERATSGLRPVNLAVPGNVEAWVTAMGPGAGGVEANIARWYGQMGKPAPDADDIAQLPRQPLLGEEAMRVELTSADGDTRLVALGLFADDRSVFVRMTGPAAAFDAEREHFDDFVASLRDAAPQRGASRDTRPVGPQPASGGTGGRSGSAAGLGFEVPDGWSPLPERMMREAYHDAGDGVEFWMTPLGGDGGGLVPNVQRWCSQVGLPAMTAEQIADLPKIDVLGMPSTFVDLTDHGGPQGMLGVACIGTDSSLFLKMFGPREAVRAKADEFRAFCESVRTR